MSPVMASFTPRRYPIPNPTAQPAAARPPSGTTSSILHAGTPPPFAAPVAPESLVPSLAASLVSQREGQRLGKRTPVLLVRAWGRLRRDGRQHYTAHKYRGA